MPSTEADDREIREDALLAILEHGTLNEQRHAILAAGEDLLTKAALRRALGLRPAARDRLLDRPSLAQATLDRIALVLARMYATDPSAAVPPADFVARLADRFPDAASCLRERLLAAVPDAADGGPSALRRTIEAALLCPALDEHDLLTVTEAADDQATGIFRLAATHPAAGSVLWHRLLDRGLDPTVAGAIAAMPAARADERLRARLEAGPPEAQAELAIDAPREAFARTFERLANERPDLALQVLDRAHPPRSEWVAAEALARLLEADEAVVRQATIAALGRLRRPAARTTPEPEVSATDDS